MLPDDVKFKVDKVIELEKNAGHIKGNSQLLVSGLDEIPACCKYTVLLEADTWLFSDKVLDKYINQCSKTGAVWASAEWFQNYYSVAVDFAIAESDYIKKNKDIFFFTKHAESYVYNFLTTKEVKFYYIREFSPVHYPKILKYIPKCKGRIHYSVRGKMVSHHIEHLSEGMKTKKIMSNIITNKRIFENIKVKYLKSKYIMTIIIDLFLRITPKKQWIIKKKVRQIE